jgi:CheY-like chemotaxis protein
MPVMDGLTSSREIRQFERQTKRMPATIIALTGAASPAAKQEAYSSGVDKFMAKPVPMKTLKGILDDVRVTRTARQERSRLLNEGLN